MLPHLLLFHEPRCAGESIALHHASDLCGLTFPTGVAAQDNVASILLIESDRAFELLGADVYGMCRNEERPADPMLIESVSERSLLQGCVDLQFGPLQGHIELRVGGEITAGEL